MKRIRIGFFTGWRCEYGLTVELLRILDDDPEIELLIYPNGLHLLKKFGYTVDEIEEDGFTIGEKIYSYTEKGEDKVFELTNSINMIYKVISEAKLDGIIVNGDRIEAYAAALSAHFCKIPIFHIGGGVITKGAVDDIYRYNITNLADVHFVTNKSAYERLLKLETLNIDNIHFSGSTAIDRILKFKKEPGNINDIFPAIRPGRFALMTFHPVTRRNEPTKDIMGEAIGIILKNKFDVLITYPNNDVGYERILSEIEKWSSNPNVFVSKNLGAKAYYSALNDCTFVIGNSSSGVIEAPYFNKVVLNVGSRQEGRDKDDLVKDIGTESMLNAINEGFKDGWKNADCSNLYGSGDSSKKIVNIIKKYSQ